MLELTPLATATDIKKAWHKQLQVWHPDRFTHAPALHRKAEALTTSVNQAYQTLNDPTARQWAIGPVLQERPLDFRDALTARYGL